MISISVSNFSMNELDQFWNINNHWNNVSKICIKVKSFILIKKKKWDTNPADAILKVIQGKENNKPYVTYRLEKKMW